METLLIGAVFFVLGVLFTVNMMPEGDRGNE